MPVCWYQALSPVAFFLDGSVVQSGCCDFWPCSFQHHPWGYLLQSQCPPAKQRSRWFDRHEVPAGPTLHPCVLLPGLLHVGRFHPFCLVALSINQVQQPYIHLSWHQINNIRSSWPSFSRQTLFILYIKESTYSLIVLQVYFKTGYHVFLRIVAKENPKVRAQMEVTAAFRRGAEAG
jgi:hypothetical protein